MPSGIISLLVIPLWGRTVDNPPHMPIALPDRYSLIAEALRVSHPRGNQCTFVSMAVWRATVKNVANALVTTDPVVDLYEFMKVCKAL